MTTLPDYQDALERSLAASWLRTPVVSCPLDDAAGHVLAADLLADRDLPPFNRAAMDGYALRHQDLCKSLTMPCDGFIPAGQPAHPYPALGSCVGIATGAPIPSGLDTVIPHELSDRKSPVTFTRQVAYGNAVHAQGSDAKAGDVLSSSGTRVSSIEIGLAAMVGQSTLAVHRPARVAIISSGDEIVPINSRPANHQIRNSNLPMVKELVESMGGIVTSATCVSDDYDEAKQAMEIERTDMVITIGGISAGDRDIFRDVIESVTTVSLVRGAGIQPGKPIWITGTGPANELRPIVSLPGNPVSALSTCCLFVWPLLNRLRGMDGTLPWTMGQLGSETMRNHRRRRFRPAYLDAAGKLHTPPWQGSGDLVHATGCAGLVEIESGADPVAQDSAVRWLPWP